ncbi:MAG: hypothetical protein NPIRA02_37020 [Nitrospirales bacterium]|nr:MAG: hypothetical protein NPIRA02_37020 [Nitrospirales bacterium]
MPVASFPIKTYTVRVARNKSVPFARLTISGPIMTHGIQDRATLYFFPTYTNLNGFAANVGGLNFDGVHVFAQIPFDDFDRMYDEIRNEAPLHLYYTYGSSSTTTKPLNLVAIDSGNEPPGEGPEDADSVETVFQDTLATIGDVKASTPSR